MARNRNFRRLEIENDKGTKLVLTQDGMGYAIYTVEMPYNVKFVAYNTSHGAILEVYQFLNIHPEIWETLEAI